MPRMRRVGIASVPASSATPAACRRAVIATAPSRRARMWQTGPGRDNLHALGLAAGGVGGWFLFATEYDVAGVLAGFLGLGLILVQVPIERALRPRLIRSLVIDERPQPTTRVLEQRPG